MIAVAFWLAVSLALPGLVPAVAEAARPPIPAPTPFEIRGRAGSLGWIPPVVTESGQAHVSADRLAVVLGGSWIARGDRGSLAVGARAAHFTRGVASVVVQGQVIRLSSTPRVGASGWLLPADFLARALGRLVPGATAARPGPAPARAGGGRPTAAAPPASPAPAAPVPAAKPVAMAPGSAAPAPAQPRAGSEMAFEVRARTRTLGSLPAAARDRDSGPAYVSAERLAVVLGGSWIARGDRGSLAAGGRAAHFTRGAASVVVEGQVVRLSSMPRVERSGWLLPADVLDAALGRLVPGATAVRREPTSGGAAGVGPPARGPAASAAPAPPVPGAKPAAAGEGRDRPEREVEIRAGGRPLESVPAVALESGHPYVSAERLALALGGSWISRGERGSLAVGPRAAHFTRDAASVVVQGQVIGLSSTPRVGPSGWLLPADFLTTALGRLVPGATVARPELPPVPAPAATRAPGRIPAAPVSPGPAAAATSQARGAPRAHPPVALTELRHRSYPGYTRVVVETGAALPQLVEPGAREIRARLPGLALGDVRADAVGDGMVEEIRLEPVGADGLLRIALASPPAEIQTLSLEDPHRLVIDIHRPPDPGQIAPPPGPDRGLRLIVIDPGHGGHDPGAIGPTGLAEKDVVLDVSRRVARLVEEGLGIRVAMTRSRDVFVPLRERTNFANRQRADLFVSIHANAHPRALSQGVETYFLSSEATDNEARQVAAIENGVLQLETPAQRQNRGALKNILWDLAQSEFQQESSVMAETVQDRMTGSLGLVNRGVKQAGFYVLGGAAMPAVLIEVGFLTNPREERKLASPAHREAVAEAIYAGLAEYKRRHDQRMRAAGTPPARSQTR